MGRMAKTTADDGALKRLGGGRWQTRDERFTIEPQSGTWVVLDADQTDDLGLPLVRGPFGSLNAAKEAIALARGAEPAVSPLAAKVAEHVERPSTVPTRGGRPYVARAGGVAPTQKPEPRPAPVEPAPAPEPKWIRDLKPAERARARELIEKLEKAGALDPEGIAEREIAGKVPAVTAFALDRAVAALGSDAAPGAVAALLAEGVDAELGVGWRLVDADSRPIAPVRDKPIP
jgi:hypothetical protein